MKICLCSFANAPSLQRYARYAANELSAGNEVHLITTVHFEPNGLDPSVVHHPAASMKSPRLDPGAFNYFRLRRILSLLKRKRPDVIHFLSAHPWNLVVASRAQALGIKTVFTIHDPVAHPGEAATQFVEMYNRFAMGKLADTIVLHGSSHVQTLIERGVARERMAVVPLGEVLPPVDGLPMPGKPHLLFFGRIKPYKGLADLVEAMEMVLEKIPEAILTIAGAGDLKDAARRIRTPGAYRIDNRLIPESEVSAFYNAAQLVVLPYTSATQSGVIPLAYSYCRPVVATTVGALPEMVVDNKTGVLVPPQDPRGLADAMIRLLGDQSTLERMGREAFMLYERRYTPKAMAEGFAAVYEKLLPSILS